MKKYIAALLTVTVFIAGVLSLPVAATGEDFAEMTVNGGDKVVYENQRALITVLEDDKNATATISIKLLQDVELYKPLPIAAGQTVTLDLNGYTLSNSTEMTGSEQYVIKNQGSLTIEDRSENQGGSIIFRGSGGGSAAIWNEATLEMSGGALKVSSESNNGSAAACLVVTGSSARATVTGGTFTGQCTNILVRDGGTAEVQNVTLNASGTNGMAVKVTNGRAELKNVTVNSVNGASCIEAAAGGTVTLDECTFTQTGTSSDPSASTAVAASSGGTVTVKSGTYTSDRYGIYVSSSGGTINIEGGSFQAPTIFKADDLTDGATATSINVSGGEFESTPANAAAACQIGEGCALNISAGTYNFALDNSYCAKGFKVKQNEDGSYTIVSSYVAQVGEKKYETIKEALEAIKTTAATIQLLADVEEDVTIGEGQTVTIDLNGYTLTNVSSHTIYNEGTLTLTDSTSTGKGTVDNITHAKAAVYNTKDATITSITNCTLTRSQEQSNNPKNSWYVLYNQGTINELNATITNTSSFSSLICNVGSAPGAESSYTATIGAITGGTYRNRANVIKNDDNSYIGTISGGTFVIEPNDSGQADYSTNSVILNYGRIATISGGSFTNKKPAEAYGIVCKSWKSDTGSIGEIKDGVTVTASYAALAVSIDEEAGWTAEAPSIEISGGTFVSNSGYTILVGSTGGNITAEGGTYTGAIYAAENGSLSVQNSDLSQVSSLAVNKNAVLTYNYWGDTKLSAGVQTEPSLQSSPSANTVNAPAQSAVTADKTGSLMPAAGSPSMQYRLQGTDSWSDIEAGVTGLEPGVYEIRYKPTSQFPESVYTYLILETSVPEGPKNDDTTAGNGAAAKPDDTSDASAASDKDGSNGSGQLTSGTTAQATTSPATGDSANLWLPVFLLLLSFAGISGSAVLRRWKENHS